MSDLLGTDLLDQGGEDDIRQLARVDVRAAWNRRDLSERRALIRALVSGHHCSRRTRITAADVRRERCTASSRTNGLARIADL